MGKREKRIDFETVVKNKKLPILTIDARWHELFPDGMKSPRIKELEQELNNLLKKQGKTVNDIKDMKRLKSDLMKEIVVNMDIRTDILGKEKEKKLDKNKQYINDLNEKIKGAMDELSDLPYRIKEVNEELMVNSMKICYEQLNINKQEIAGIAEWIGQIRDELKIKILAKQDMESKNTMIYTYMHDILGAEIMEAFDNEYGRKAKK